MKQSKELRKAVSLALAMLLVSLALVPGVSAQVVKDEKAAGVLFTSDELMNLYSKYNISKNDIRFAENRLPNFLEGTILDGKTRVIATETGKLPEGLKKEWIMIL